MTRSWFKRPAYTEAAPFSLCGDIAPAFEGLMGLRIGPGWRKAVLQRMAGVHGCTHLTDLLIGPVTQTAMQTVGPARSRRQTPGRPGAKPAVIDSCHALAASGPIVAREWPEFYTGPKAGGEE